MTQTWSLTPFFNELDVLAIRLAELDAVVDKHVICEADYTYAGHEKPFHLADALEKRDPRIEPFAEKIILVHSTAEEVDYQRVPTQAAHYPAPDQIQAWQRENHQRRALMVVTQEGLDHADTVLLSDVDEIPRASVVDWYTRVGGTFLYRPALAMHVGALNWRWSFELPVICRLFSGQALLPPHPLLHDPMAICASDTEALRALPGVTMPGNPNGDDPISEFGWHLSYMGGPETIAYKLREAAHPEMATPAVLDPAHLERVTQRGDELFGRERGVHWVPNTEPFLPASARAYAHLEAPDPTIGDE